MLVALDDRTVPAQVLYEGTTNLTDLLGGDVVRLTTKVTSDDPNHSGRVLWEYKAESVSYKTTPENPPGDPLQYGNTFAVPVADTSVVVQLGPGGFIGPGYVGWDASGIVIDSGWVGNFWFSTTPAVSVVDVTASLQSGVLQQGPPDEMQWQGIWREESGSPDEEDSYYGNATGPAKGPEGPPKIIFTNAAGNEVDPAVGLKVAKWHDAFELAGEPLSARIRPPGTDGLDFIDRDDDRFNVRVFDPTAWRTGAQTLDVTIWTAESGEHYNDPSTTLRLVRMTVPGNTNWYWSDSQMMVSNKIDDEYSDANVAVDEAAPGGGTNNKLGHSFPLSDRTHRVALGGKVHAKYIPTNGPEVTTQREVRVKKHVKVHITIVKNTAGGAAPISEADATKEVERANEQYAQVGIKLVPVSPQTVDPPLGVVLVGTFQEKGLDGYSGATLTSIPMTNEEKALMGDEHVTLRTAATDDIELYFVNFINTAAPGQAYWAGGVPDQKYADSIVIGVESIRGNPPTLPARPFTVAHEIGHILMNSGDHFEVGMKDVNLMRSPTSTSDTVTATKRFILEQEEVLLTARPNLLGD